MQIKITASRDEKIWSAIIGVILIIAIYLYNRTYLFIINVEFEANYCSKILIKVGYIFPKKIEITTDKEKPVSKTAYGYTLTMTPQMDDNNNADGRFELTINRGKNSDIPYKKIMIEKDDYYVQYMKTPLGKIR